jgi:murein DD-endopeptidase MepM/ murein hydrolase activator NlpD
MPVAGADAQSLSDSFHAARSGRRTHHAIDIPAPRGTPVVAACDGFVMRISVSAKGGLGVYQVDRRGRFGFYYAHLDDYAPGLYEGMEVAAGDLLGYVGTTGNAPENLPHLHFAITRVRSARRWWAGTPVNPYPLLAEVE